MNIDKLIELIKMGLTNGIDTTYVVKLDSDNELNISEELSCEDKCFSLIHRTKTLEENLSSFLKQFQTYNNIVNNTKVTDYPSNLYDGNNLFIRG